MTSSYIKAPLLPLHRYNTKLPSAYRSQLQNEQRLNLLALRTLATKIGSEQSAELSLDSLQDGYEREVERDFAALEKALVRYLDLKYLLEPVDYDVLVAALLRGIFTRGIDVNLRAKLARATVKLLRKRGCTLTLGLPWRAIKDLIVRVHIDSADGTEVIGTELRDSHGRHMTTLLKKSRNFLGPHDTAEAIWKELGEAIDVSAADRAFEPALFLCHALPTRGDAWTEWVPKAIELWSSIDTSSDWDSIWISLIARVATHQPGRIDWTPYLSTIYDRISSSFRLPLGSVAPHSPGDRRCPAFCVFLLNKRITEHISKFIVYSLSPESPETLIFLKRLIDLVANFFHPSNGGRWSSTLASFLGNFTSRLAARVLCERNATAAGVSERVIGSNSVKPVPEAKHRLPAEYVNELVELFLPIVYHGLHSKHSYMSAQAATSARDLAVLAPDLVIPPLLTLAAEGLACVSSPHRTSAALRMLAALTPVFLDKSIFSTGFESLPRALELSLPGIDPNDPSKTEATLRFIAGASVRLQSLSAQGEGESELSYFLEDFVYQLLERVFALLESLEAPPKKSHSGHTSSPLLSIVDFLLAMETLFGAVSPQVAVSTAEKIARQISGAAVTNALKFYGALVRISAAAAAAATKKSSAHIFMPLLIGQVLEEVDGTSEIASANGNTLSSLSEEELVWRIRMLAQASRTCAGFAEYTEQLCEIVELAMARPSRKIYKAGARLLRGMLEGLNATRPVFRSELTEGEHEYVDARSYTVEWREPSLHNWTEAETLLQRFLDVAAGLIYGEGSKRTFANGKPRVIIDRDVLFRALRMLHGIQRGGRWLLAGAQPEGHSSVEDFVKDGKIVTEMTKETAKRILKRPVAAGFGGEEDRLGAKVAIKMWDRCYTMVSDILDAVLAERPDDGALLYRCLEPIELAHEPFKRSSRSRFANNVGRLYKSQYANVMLMKKDHGSEGGVGRFLPRFIIKWRIEALHEYRLELGARSGAQNKALFNRILCQLSLMAVNDFPRVRIEARGALTRAFRVASASVRRKEIIRVINFLSLAAQDARKKQATESQKRELPQTDASKGGAEAKTSDEEPHFDTYYERMIGAADVLRSSAASPIMMRDWELLNLVARALLESILYAELPEAIAGVTALYAKLATNTRPLGIEPLRVPSLEQVAAPTAKSAEDIMGERATVNCDEKTRRRSKAYEQLNMHLLEVLSDTGKADADAQKTVNSMVVNDSVKRDAHWRLQSLVATTLYMCIREDRPPPAEVAKFFVEHIVSDVVSLRHISCKAVALILVLHGNGNKACRSQDSNNAAIKALRSVLTRDGFAKRLVHTLALDHEDPRDSGSRGGFRSVASVMALPKLVDGDACWGLVSGRPWPYSWVSRSRDSLGLTRVRLYEFMFRAFGCSCFDVFKSPVEEMIGKLKRKEEHIISGVKDDDVRVVAAELIAGMGRGLAIDIIKNQKGHVLDVLLKWAFTLLDNLTGPQGIINGGTLLRLLATSEDDRVGREMASHALKRLMHDRPIVLPMDSGAVAHLQARRLRYLHACVADVPPGQADGLAVELVKEGIKDLTRQVAFSHESKAVREEVARCLSLFSSFGADDVKEILYAAAPTILARIRAPPDEQDGSASEGGKAPGETSDSRNEIGLSDGDVPGEGGNGEQGAASNSKKVRSREGETLSRWVSIVYWNGDTQAFKSYIARLLPALFILFDDSDPERLYHARLALSLAAQAKLDPEKIDEIISLCEESAGSPRWRVRAAVIPFVQVIAFTRLFTARSSSLSRIRAIVIRLLSDAHLEVREAAGATFVPLIRDAPSQAVANARDHFLKIIKNTKRRPARRRNKKGLTATKAEKLSSEELQDRHGAVLGLSSMVMSSPYSVPPWMPSVLVALTGCVEDAPPISRSAKKLFADFWRTHRDEWHVHKQRFSSDDLELVSELLISPSYYA